MRKKLAILPGDGIGVDVTREAVKVVEVAASVTSTELLMDSFDYGAERFLRTGETLPDDVLESFRAYDAIFMGALGDPRVPDMRHARDILLGTRFKLDLFTNLRPVRCLHDRLCPLKQVSRPRTWTSWYFGKTPRGSTSGWAAFSRRARPTRSRCRRM